MTSPFGRLVLIANPKAGLGNAEEQLRQIGGELEQEAWIVAEVHPDDPFGDGDLWADVLSRKGGEYALLARMPPDPSVN